MITLSERQKTLIDPNFGVTLLRKSSGFSLVELMITVGIAGTLSAVSVNSYARFKYRAQRAVVIADASTFSRTVQALRVAEDGKTLMQITGSSCSMCNMSSGNISAQTGALAAQAANWRKLGYDTAPKDPWGSPYMLDENEGEFGPSDCRMDAIWSGGPNGKWEGWDDTSGNQAGVIDQSGQDDDLVMLVPPSTKCRP